MIVPPGNRLARLLALGCSAALLPLAGWAASGQHAPSAGRAEARIGTSTPPRASLAGGEAASVGSTTAASDPVRLASELASAEKVLGEGRASPAVMARQALIVQAACLRLAGRPGLSRTIIKHVAWSQRGAAAGDIAAVADLAALASPTTKLPRWKIVPADSLASLRADYQAAQGATGVPWTYLAAINFAETDFGRIAGLSSAGAEGPMQFIPSTWALYGHGDVHRPRNAIAAAARFLADHGAPGDIDAAVHAYNPSWRYVDAIRRYATRLSTDPDALSGYYYRAVTYRLNRGWVLLPPGYGPNSGIRPVPIRT
jgi:hypothetical protein